MIGRRSAPWCGRLSTYPTSGTSSSHAPRTAGNLERFELPFDATLRAPYPFDPPVGYVEFMRLVRWARCVITDSGGVQEETTCLGSPAASPGYHRAADHRDGGDKPARSGLMGSQRRRFGAGRQLAARRRPELWGVWTHRRRVVRSLARHAGQAAEVRSEITFEALSLLPGETARVARLRRYRCRCTGRRYCASSARVQHRPAPLPRFSPRRAILQHPIHVATIASGPFGGKRIPVSPWRISSRCPRYPRRARACPAPWLRVASRG